MRTLGPRAASSGTGSAGPEAGPRGTVTVMPAQSADRAVRRPRCGLFPTTLSWRAGDRRSGCRRGVRPALPAAGVRAGADDRRRHPGCRGRRAGGLRAGVENAGAYDARPGNGHHLAAHDHPEPLHRRRAGPAGPRSSIPTRSSRLNLTSTEPLPEELAALRDDADRVCAALSRLPIEQRRALVMAGLLGHTAREVSEAEGIPLGTAKTRIRTGSAATALGAHGAAGRMTFAASSDEHVRLRRGA